MDLSRVVFTSPISLESLPIRAAAGGRSGRAACPGTSRRRFETGRRVANGPDEAPECGRYFEGVGSIEF